MIPFTIRANATVPEHSVVITVIDDDQLEPEEEGFRLVLIADPARTPRSHVAYGSGRQLALFRIDDHTDSEFWMT